MSYSTVKKFDMQEDVLVDLCKELDDKHYCQVNLDIVLSVLSRILHCQVVQLDTSVPKFSKGGHATISSLQYIMVFQKTRPWLKYVL